MPVRYERSLMSGNATFNMTDTAIVSIAHVDAPEVVTSARFDEMLAETYQRVGAQPGLLENLAGIRERRWWPEGYRFTDAAAAAGAKAIEASGVRVDEIGLLIDTSVCRDRLEPSSSVTVHDALDLPSWCLNFDLSNACLGFVNALQVAGNMIDAGQINYALIVDGEGSRLLQETTLARLAGPDATMADLFAEFASLTLGSGGAAAVVGRHSENPGSHRVVGGIARADTSHHGLCVGSLDQMRTDTKSLLDAGLQVSKLAWIDSDELGWLDADRYIIHQVSQVHTRMLCEYLGIDMAKAPLTFPFLGNVGPASIPITLSREVDSLEAGDMVLLLGIGSGINASAIELLW
jgi:3-oxoacyl-[acyl-carrier-protein] synthase III